MKEYEKGTGNSTTSDPLKIHAVMQLVPTELEKDIKRLSSSLKTYPQVKNYVMEQVNIRKDPHFSEPPAATPMDVDALLKLVAEGQFDKD